MNAHVLPVSQFFYEYGKGNPCCGNNILIKRSKDRYTVQQAAAQGQRPSLTARLEQKTSMKKDYMYRLIKLETSKCVLGCILRSCCVALKRWPLSFIDKIIPLFPNLQSHDDDPYEEGVLDLRFGWIHHRLEFNIIIQLMFRCQLKTQLQSCQCFLHRQTMGWSRSRVPILMWSCELQSTLWYILVQAPPWRRDTNSSIYRWGYLDLK
jgi:hypothetical protein